MDNQPDSLPPRYSYPVTAVLFALGGLVTALFSVSLAWLTSKAGLLEVLAIGMIVPSFTWVVQLSASGLLLSSDQRRLYWGDLARICLLGSFALLPAAAVNLTLADPPRWISAANVLASVILMGADLFRRSAAHRIALVWPIMWCVTISLNMCLFLLSSWGWW